MNWFAILAAAVMIGVLSAMRRQSEPEVNGKPRLRPAAHDLPYAAVHVEGLAGKGASATAEKSFSALGVCPASTSSRRGANSTVTS